MLLLKPRWRKSARKSSRADVDRLVVLVGAGRRKAGMRRRRICRSTRTDPTERGWKPRRATALRTSQVKWNGVLVDFDVCCCKSSIRLTGCRQALYSSQRPSAWNAGTEGNGNGDVVLGCENADSVASNAQYAGVSQKASREPQQVLVKDRQVQDHCLGDWTGNSRSCNRKAASMPDGEARSE